MNDKWGKEAPENFYGSDVLEGGKWYRERRRKADDISIEVVLKAIKKI